MHFAAILADGSVVTWGSANAGADSSSVHELTGVQRIQSTDDALAAILTDGSVVTWGPDRGGDSSTVQDELIGGYQLQAAIAGAFAALADGSVASWGLALVETGSMSKIN